MTNLSYNILVNNKVVSNVTSYNEALAQVKMLGRSAKYEAVYDEFNADETAETRSNLRKHAVKAAEKRAKERKGDK